MGKPKVEGISFIIAIVLTLLVSLGLNLVLGLSEFEGVYRGAMVNRYGTLAKDVKTQMENALSLGKPLHLMGDTVDLAFEQTKAQDRGISHMYVVDTSGAVLYSTRAVAVGKNMPVAYSRGAANPGGADLVRMESSVRGESIFVTMPLYRTSRYYEGQLFLEFSRSLITDSILKVLRDLGLVAAAVFAVALALFLLIRGIAMGAKRPLKAGGAVAVILVILFLSQAGFAYAGHSYYAKAYTQAYQENVSVLSTAASRDLDKVLGYGVPLERLKGADAFLEERIKGSEECSAIFVLDGEGKPLYQAGGGGRASVMEDPSALDPVMVPVGLASLLPADGPEAMRGAVYSALIKGYLGLRINEALIRSRLNDMALDSLTIGFVSLIVAYMLLELLRLGQGRASIAGALALEGEGRKAGLRLIMLSSFIFNFGAFVPLAFLPQHIQRVYEASAMKFLGWDRTIMVSIPIAAYMVGITVAMLLIIFVFKFLSLKARYGVISVLFTAGSLMTVFAGDIIVMSLARFVAGMGFGGALLATTSLVTSYTDDKNRSSGFGISAAGFAAASICSVPIGGVIVNRLGTAAGLYTAAVFGLLFLVFILAFLRKEEGREEEKRPAVKLGFSSWLRILFSRHILTYTFFMNIPFQILYWGLFQYVLPLYMSSEMGVSDANIGRILSMFCVISLFAAGASRLADRLMNDKLLLSLGALIVGSALLLFNLVPTGGILLFIGTIAAMGVQNLFVDSIEEVYISKGKVRVEVDEETLLHSYKTVEKIISTVIPTLSGLLMLAAGFEMGMFIIGVYTIVGAVLFFITAVNGRRAVHGTKGVAK